MVVTLHLPVPYCLYTFDICVVGILEGRQLKVIAGNNFFDINKPATFVEDHTVMNLQSELYYDELAEDYFECSPEMLEVMELAMYKMCDDFDIECDIHHTYVEMSDGMQCTVLSYDTI